MFICHHGEGDTRISSHAFEQLETDSDRAAGIVAGSIVEQRLKGYTVSRFPKTDTAQQRLTDLFHSSAAFGSFSVKIDATYLFGLINEQSHKDLNGQKFCRP